GQNRFFGPHWQTRSGILVGVLALMWLLFMTNDWWVRKQEDKNFVQADEVVLTNAQDSLRWFHYQGVLVDSLGYGYDSARYWFQQPTAIGPQDEETYLPLKLSHARSLFNEMIRLYQDSAYAESEAKGVIFNYYTAALESIAAFSEAGQQQLQASAADRSYLIGLNQLYQASDSSEQKAVNTLYERVPRDYFQTDNLNAFTQNTPLSWARILSKLDEIWLENDVVDRTKLDSLYQRLGGVPPTEDTLSTRPPNLSTALPSMDSDTMWLDLVRYSFGEHDILGQLSINGKFQCYTLEDAFRIDKVREKTAIPAGTYALSLREQGRLNDTYGKRFRDIQKGMLWLQDVPNFQFIYLVIGNQADEVSGGIAIGLVSDQNIPEYISKVREILETHRAYEKV
ncbi:MAG: DUF5675 family protein, partial [Bacteroidota bacterium]